MKRLRPGVGQKSGPFIAWDRRPSHSRIFFGVRDFQKVVPARRSIFVRYIKGCCRPCGRVERIYFLSRASPRGAVKSLGGSRSDRWPRRAHLFESFREVFFEAGLDRPLRKNRREIQGGGG
jgi:hypothetical protein